MSRLPTSGTGSRDRLILHLATSGNEDQALSLLRTPDHEARVTTTLKRRLRGEFLITSAEARSDELLKDNQSYCDLEMHIWEQIYARLGTVLQSYNPALGTLDGWLIERVKLLTRKWLHVRRDEVGSRVHATATDYDVEDRMDSECDELASSDGIVARVSGLRDSWQACLTLKILPLHHPDTKAVQVIVSVAQSNNQAQPVTLAIIDQLTQQYSIDAARSEKHWGLEEKLAGTTAELQKAEDECTYCRQKLSDFGLSAGSIDALQQVAASATLESIELKYPAASRYQTGRTGKQTITPVFWEYRFELWVCRRKRLRGILQRARSEYESLTGIQMSEPSGSGIQFEGVVAAPLPDEEIARALNTSKSSVTSALNKAKKHLEQQLADS